MEESRGRGSEDFRELALIIPLKRSWSHSLISRRYPVSAVDKVVLRDIFLGFVVLFCFRNSLIIRILHNYYRELGKYRVKKMESPIISLH